MRQLLCILLVLSILVSFPLPSFASGTEEPQYGILNTEFSDALGRIEQLDVMVLNSHVYVDVETLSTRLGFKCIQDADVVSIYADNNFFYHAVPLIAVHFKINSTEVSYNPLFGAEYKYTSPAPCVANDKGVWVPLGYTITLLGASSTTLEDTLLVQMPRENVLSVAAMIAHNEQTISFDWANDFGYSETAIGVANGAARLVTLFKGLLEFDGAAWLSVIDWDAFDRKFGASFLTMFCTNSSDELQKSVEEVELLLEVFSDDGKLGEMLRNEQYIIDADVSEWGRECEKYLEMLEAGSGSPTKYNLLYRQYERAMDQQTLFATLGEDNLRYIQKELGKATNVLDFASKLGSAVCYLQEFQQKDEYMLSALKNYLSQRTVTDEISDATVGSMRHYLNLMNSNALSYSIYRFIEENWLKSIVDYGHIDTLLGAPANVMLLAWDIMSGTIPFYSKGLGAVENREISNYAQKLQNDALYNLNNLLSELKYGDTISAQDCVKLSEYCYVYLKASYIARSAAIKSLDSTSDEFQKQIKDIIDSNESINRIIAQNLVLLSGADANNSYPVLGFLPENSKEFIEDYSDTSVLSAINANVTLSGTNAYDDILSMYYTGISCNWSNCDGEGMENVGDPDNACYIFSRYEKNRSLNEVGYALFNINNDDQPELFISLPDIADSGSFYDMYTISDGEIIHVITAGERNRYNLAEDFSINNNGSSSAATGAYANYRLDNTNGKLNVNYFIDYDYNREPRYYYTTTGCLNGETYEITSAELEPISNEEASVILDRFPDNAPISLIPFSEYKNSHGQIAEGFSANEGTLVASGDCGDNLSWALTDDGTLTISGSGDMDNYAVGDDGPPWLEEDVEVTQIVLDGNITSIGENAFCQTFIKNITIPASVSAIQYGALNFIDTLEGIWVETGNTVYSNDDSGVLFDKDKTVLISAPTRLTGTYTVPMSVTWIYDNAFLGCAGIKTISWPDRISRIGQGAFSGCSGLEYICIPSNVTVIEPYTFYACSNMTGIRIPAGITSIGWEAFGECPLKDVFYGGTNQQWKQLMGNCSDDTISGANVYELSY